ncbi:MAG: hypothetical protein R8P61_12700 [Bacteroidia bacterium]|nr:hypothetical protein [Bacteroidia bacterium]
MKTSTYPNLILLSLFLFIYSGTQSQAYKFFEYPEGKNARVYALDNFEEEEPFLLAFQFESHLDFLFLDQEMDLKRKVQSEDLPSRYWGREIQSIMNSEKEVLVFLDAGTRKNSYRSLLYRFNKDTGSYKDEEVLDLPEEIIAMLEKEKVKLLKVFQYGDRFYKIWVDVKRSQLHIFYYELGENRIAQFESLNIPQAGLGKLLGKRKVIPTPVITHPEDASVISNAKQEKIYAFGEELLLTIENFETGHTEIIAINTESWDLTVEFYPIANYQPEDEVKQFNSYIYGGHLFQVYANSEGLTLTKRSFDNGELIIERSWDDRSSFYEDFQFRRKRQFVSGRMNENEDPKLWRQFERSLAVVIQEEGDYERLIIGSHRYMKQKDRDVVNTLGAIASVAAETGAGVWIGGNGAANVFIDPFTPINMVIDAVYYFSEGRIFQGDTYFNSETFAVAPEGVETGKWDRILKRVNDEEMENNVRSISLFEFNQKVYYGYWRKKKYYLLEM